MYNEFILWFSARLVDLVILTVAFVYIYRTYLSPMIAMQMHNEREEKAELEQARVAAKKEVHALKEAYAHDQACIQELKKEVTQWQQAVQQKHAAYQKECEAVAHKMQQIQEQHMQAVADQKLYRKVVPAAFEQAEQQLKEQFSDANRQKAYLDKVLAIIKEEQV